MIELKEVTKEYSKGIAALNGINLRIEQGEFVFVVGDSGSGKSTLIRLLMKEIEPTSGTIIVNGQNLNRMKHRQIPQYRRGIGVVAGAELLRKDGIKVRIVSVPSEGLFRTQSKEYQESVLPKGSKIFGMTAGLPVTLEGLVGANGKVFGMTSFGFSAPYKVLDEKLGYTAENVYKQVKTFMEE